MTIVAEKPTRSARKPKGEGHARRAEILEAAERIFVECGYEGATIRKIAEDVGVSSTALYMHFRDKSEILLEICRQAFDTLFALNSEVLATELPPLAKARRMTSDYMRFGLENPNAYRLVFCTRPQEASHGAEDVAQELGGRLFDRFTATVAAAYEAGQIRLQPKVAAQTLWAGAHGLVALMITKPYFDWADREQLTETMLDTLFEGLAKA